MLARLAFAAALLAAGQMMPNAASACLIFPSHQIARIDAELPKAKLSEAQIAQVKTLRAEAADLAATNKAFDANRAAMSALSILGYNPPGPPSRC